MEHKLGLDRADFLAPSVAAAILQFRSTTRSAISQETPLDVQAALSGEMAEVYIKEAFPRATCFLLVDLEALAIRWSAKHFIATQSSSPATTRKVAGKNG